MCACVSLSPVIFGGICTCGESRHYFVILLLFGSSNKIQ